MKVRTGFLTVLGRCGVLCAVTVLLLLGGCRKKPAQHATSLATTTDNPRTTPLHRAVDNDDIEAVRKLLAEGTDVNARDANGRVALHEAAYKAPAALVQLLISHGADVNARDNDGESPLDRAFVREGREGIIELLLRSGAQPAIGHLASAAWLGNVHVAALLIQKGVDPNSRVDGYTPLHVALEEGHEEMVRFLVARGANVNARTAGKWNRTGVTPLHLAAGRGDRGLVEFLIGRGADINACNREGDPPLLFAAMTGRGDAVQVLVEAGADATVKDTAGRTLLHLAVQALDSGGATGTLGPLIAGGINVNAKTEAGFTALHFAARNGHVRAAELLLAAGADMNAQTPAGQAPLHFAVRRGYYSLAELLVEEGADRSVRTRQGKTPLDYALTAGRDDLVSLLKGEGHRTTQDLPAEERTDGATTRPTGPLTDVDRLVRDNSAFALDLYEHLRGAEGNLFFSPYSISTALVMTYAGARENTARQMADTLHFSLDPNRLHPAFAALQAGLNKVQETGNVKLSTANALWPQEGHPFLAEYLSLIKMHYGVSITVVDYSTGTTREAARQTINHWVEGRTEDRIKELVRPEHLNDATRLVLTNAIYFNGKWKNEFDPQKTRDETFYLSAAKSISVPVMHQTEDFGYAEDSSVQILELPYRGDELSMLILLPARIEGLDQLEKRLTLEDLDRWRNRLQKTEVIVSMPRFKMTSESGLKAVLKKMGMVEAFTWPGADFAGLDGDPNWFYIGEVVHKAYVDVNEEGTEAAAVMMLGGAPPKPPEFRADHPFLFLIQENRTGSILFLGRVVDPR